jgi:hypothetical protein
VISRAYKASAAAIAGFFGVDECFFVLALTLLAVGSYQVWPPAAALVPGAVLLWVYIPQRTPFVARPRTVKQDDK